MTSAVCRRTLDDLLMCDRLREPRFTWIVNCAKRKLPTVPYTLPAANAQVFDYMGYFRPFLLFFGFPAFYFSLFFIFFVSCR